MRMHLATGVPLALALLVGCANAAGDLKSGPQVGDGVGIFEPLGVTGAGKRNGSKFCPV